MDRGEGTMLKNNRQKVILKDVAEKAGVSISTVSRVLNNSATISQKVRKKIFAVSRALHYYPNVIARALVTRRSFTIALVVPSLSFMGGDFFQEILIGIEHELSNRFYNLLLTRLKGTEKNTFMSTVNSGVIDGALVLGDTLSAGDIRQLNTLNIPIVLLNRKAPASGISCVYINNEEGGFLAGEHLIQHGYKKLIYLGGDRYFNVTMERQKGFEDAVKKNPAITDIQYFYGSFATSFRSGYEIMKNISIDNSIKTGIFAANDNIALGAMKYLFDHGQTTGEKIGIIGYDNLQINDFSTSPLTSIDQQGRSMGEKACRILIDIVEEKTKGEHFQFHPVLVTRQSCGCRAK
jgi:LacI family transcriptional regulator